MSIQLRKSEEKKKKKKKKKGRYLVTGAGEGRKGEKGLRKRKKEGKMREEAAEERENISVEWLSEQSTTGWRNEKPLGHA